MGIVSLTCSSCLDSSFDLRMEGFYVYGAILTVRKKTEKFG